MHAAAKWLNALSTGSPRQPAEFHRPLTSLADYLFAILSLLLPSLPPSLPSSVLLQLPSPTPTAPGKQWRGGSLLWEGDMERKAGSEQEGDVREKRQSCYHTKQRVRERGEEQEREKIKISSLSQHSLTMTPGESFRSNEPENAEPPLPFILLSTTLSHHRATITFISERTVLA